MSPDPQFLYLGTTSSTDVALDALERRRHLYIVGQTGTGKSTLLLQALTPAAQALTLGGIHMELIIRNGIIVTAIDTYQADIGVQPLIIGGARTKVADVGIDALVDPLALGVRRAGGGPPFGAGARILLRRNVRERFDIRTSPRHDSSQLPAGSSPRSSCGR